MKARDKLISFLVATLLIALSSRVMASTYDDAAEAANHYIDSYEEIRTIDIDNLQRLLQAMCDSDEDERKEVFRAESARVSSLFLDQEQRLDNEKTSADSKIAVALADPQTDDPQKEQLASLQDRMSEVAERIEKIVNNGVRMGSNPAFDKMRELGQMAHDDYYDHHTECAPYRDIPVGELKPDCILPEECIVIELKPDNKRAAASGLENAEKSRDLLNEKDEKGETDDKKFFDKWLAQDKDKRMVFAGCKEKFMARVDCYHYCPDLITDGEEAGQIKSTSLDWVTCKS